MKKQNQNQNLVINGPDDIPTFEELCKIKGWDAKDKLPEVSHQEEGMQRYLLASAKREYIRQYINDGWEADFADGNQPKYYIWPWVDEDSSVPCGFRLSYNHYGYGLSCAGLGSRLYYRSAEIARHEFEKFKDTLWLDMIIVPKNK